MVWMGCWIVNNDVYDKLYNYEGYILMGYVICLIVKNVKFFKWIKLIQNGLRNKLPNYICMKNEVEQFLDKFSTIYTILQICFYLKTWEI